MIDPTLSAPPRVLFVCLGNICRSPAAAAVLGTLADRAGIRLEIDSAGTGPWHVGEPADGQMQAAAEASGYDLSGHRARQFKPEDFARFDLIVAMDRQNLEDIEAQRPPGATTPVRLFLSYGPSERVDVPDPYYEGGFDLVLRLIEHAAMGVLGSLRQGL